MRYVLVSDDAFLWELVPPSSRAHDTVYVVEEPAVRARIARHGGTVVGGHLAHDAVYRRAFRSGYEPVVVAVDPARQVAVVRAIRRVAPAAPVLVVSDVTRVLRRLPGVTTVSPCAFADRVVAPELDRAVTRARVDRIRAQLAPRARVLIMMQDDPDPDAIASALALRTLLGRDGRSAPIATFGTVTRPENRALIDLLRLDVRRIDPGDVARYDGAAMVDVQPSFFEERAFAQVDLVVDHHPEERPVHAAVKDVRPGYGATSTILTEYLRAADITPTARLATALLYGIKTDTQDLERGTTRADLDAFAFLHAHASLEALRRIQRPELSPEALDALGRGIRDRRVVDDIVFSHLGRIGYPELVAQFADLFLQVRGARWSVVSGTVNGELHVSVRAAEPSRAAGAVVRDAFGDLGSAGGHRAMAKAVVRLADWRARVGDVTGERILRRFRRALRERRG
jgi:nanoRNase/pAp phosphatase (c-di-AMP/oligoRNAs hydrolase)